MGFQDGSRDSRGYMGSRLLRFRSVRVVDEGPIVSQARLAGVHTQALHTF